MFFRGWPVARTAARAPADAMNDGSHETAMARDTLAAGAPPLAGEDGAPRPAPSAEVSLVRESRLRARAAARIGIPGLLVLAVIVFTAWQLGDPARAWPAALAVLAAGCPCALLLARPVALAAAGRRLQRCGVLALQPHALASLERATHIVFDKTGTLTLGRPQLRAVHLAGAIETQEALALAAALEAGSIHPLARALRAAAHGVAGAFAAAQDIAHTAGQGVEGEIRGVRYRLGSAAFVAGLADRRLPLAPDARGSALWLGRQGAWLARFDIADSPRPEAAQVVRRLEAAGKTVVLLSGDESRAAQGLAARLGIRLAAGDQLPGQKRDFVRELQAQGATVAMVGDGILDDAVLHGADVSFAMGGAAVQADGVLGGESLLPLADAVDTARRSQRIIRQNLAWAGLYHLAAVPLAASGLLGPWLAAAGMAASAALVGLNALRLLRRP